MGNFREFVANISPPWLRRANGERFVGMTIGLMSDLVSEGAAQALKASWLLSDTSPPDALPEIGTERSMPRYYADSDDTYRARLHAAWAAWQFAGNEEGTGGLGIVAQYVAMGLPNVSIVPAENADHRPERRSWRFELVPTIVVDDAGLTYVANYLALGDSAIIIPAGYDFATAGFEAGRTVTIIGTSLNDGTHDITWAGNVLILDGIVLSDEGPVAGSWIDGTEFSRFAVVIEEGHPWVPWTYGSGAVYGSDDASPTYGSTATVGEVRSAKAIARKWSPGHAINPYIYIIFDGEYYGDPDRLYGDAAYVYGTGTNIKWAHQV